MLLALWGRRSLQKRLPSFKLQGSSPIGGRLLDNYILPHLHSEPHICTCTNHIKTCIVLIDTDPVQCLIDSGATISLIKHDIVCDRGYQRLISPSSTLATNASGTLLEMSGRIKLPISLGSFKTIHEFMVVKHLTIDCILGAVSAWGNSGLFQQRITAG